jgi:iron complex outermembrane receptor protein
MPIRTSLQTSASVVAILSASIAFFTGAPQAKAAAADATPTHSQNAAAAASKDNATGVDELVVTAERRSENLQSTAISATVLDQKMLENKAVVGLTSLQYAAPGIQISDYGSANTFNIRGIGQSQVDIDLPSGVVIYRDGVPTLTGYFQNAPYYDMASVEVLRGPQGTFVGKSAAAGAVFIRTRDPELGHFGGDVMVGGGNRSSFEDTIVLNAPLSDTFAARISYHGERRGSLFDSIRTNPLPGGANDGGPYVGHDDRNLNSIRVGLLWQPTPQFHAVFKIDYDDLYFGSHITTGFIPTTGVEEDMSNPIVNGLHYYRDNGVRSSLNLNYDFGGGYRLSSLTGYSTVYTKESWDTNGSNPAPDGLRTAGTFTNYSQELNLTSPTDRKLSWVTGVFYQKYINSIPAYPAQGFGFFLDNGTTPFISTPWEKHELSYAAFGQLVYHLTDALDVQAGIRWSHYEFSQYTSLTLFAGTPNQILLEGPNGHTQQLSEDSVDWKINLNYKVSDTQFIYGLISRGHTPGSINIIGNNPASADHTPYGEMAVINYEAGWKGSFFDHHLNTQIATYYQTFDGYQAAFALTGPNVSQLATISEFKNANTTSDIYGIELGAQGRFGDLSVDVGMAFSRSKLGSFGIVTNPFYPMCAANPLLCSAYGSTPTINLTGARTPFAPEDTVNGGVAYTFHLTQIAQGLTMTPRVDVAYKSDSYAGFFLNRATLLPSETLLNASLRFESGPWTATLWGTNLTDRRFPGAKQNVTGAGGVIAGLVYEAPPRLFGVRVDRSF